MPHYADGTEAKVGDQVTGHLFNTPGVVAGVIISITPGAESCNAMVQFTIANLYGSADEIPRMALQEGPGKTAAPRDVQGANHGSSGSAYQLFTCADYCDTKGLTKVGP